MKREKAREEVGTRIMEDEARRISQDIKRIKPTDEEYNLRVEGFDDDGPVIQAAKLERRMRRSQEIIAERREEDEAFQRRLQKN